MNILASLSKELFAAGAGFKDAATADGWWKRFDPLVVEAEAETTAAVAFFDALPESEKKAPMMRHLHANALGQYCSVANILGHKHEMLVAARRVVEIAPQGSGEKAKHEAAVAYLEKEIRALLLKEGEAAAAAAAAAAADADADDKDISALCPAELKAKGEEAAARWRELEGRPPRRVG